MPDPSPEERELQLQFCQQALDELTSPKHRRLTESIYGTGIADWPGLKARISPNCFVIKQQLSEKKYAGFRDFEDAINAMLSSYSRAIEIVVPPGSQHMMRGEVSELTALFKETWAERHTWVAARSSLSASQPIAKDSTPNNPKADVTPINNVTAHRRSATAAGLDEGDNNNIDKASPEPSQIASKKLRLVLEAAPAKYNDSDRVFVKNLHNSLTGYLFKIKSSTYDRSTKNRRYSVFNEELLGGDQVLSIPEAAIIKPDYQKGEMFQVATVSGKTVSGAVKAVRMAEGKVEYEIAMVAEPQTYTAEQTTELFKAHA